MENNNNNTNNNNKPNSANNKPHKILRANLKEKIEVLDFLTGPPKRTQSETLVHFAKQNRFSISQATLSNWCIKEKEIRQEYDENPHLVNYRRKPVLKYPEVTKAVEQFIENKGKSGVQITDQMIKDVFTKYVQEYGYNANAVKLTGGMLHSFKKRNSISRGKISKISKNPAPAPPPSLSTLSSSSAVTPITNPVTTPSASLHNINSTTPSNQNLISDLYPHPMSTTSSHSSINTHDSHHTHDSGNIRNTDVNRLDQSKPSSIGVNKSAMYQQMVVQDQQSTASGSIIGPNPITGDIAGMGVHQQTSYSNQQSQQQQSVAPTVSGANFIASSLVNQQHQQHLAQMQNLQQNTQQQQQQQQQLLLLQNQPQPFAPFPFQAPLLAQQHLQQLDPQTHLGQIPQSNIQAPQQIDTNTQQSNTSLTDLRGRSQSQASHPDVQPQSLTNTETFNKVNNTNKNQFDFTFEDILNSSVGFNTRLIHSDDNFSTIFRGNMSLDHPNMTSMSPNLSEAASANTPFMPSMLNVQQPHNNFTEGQVGFPGIRAQLNQDAGTIDQSANLNTGRPASVTTVNNQIHSLSNYSNYNQSRPYVLENFTYSRTTHPNAEKVEKILENITDGFVTIYNSGTSAIMGILSYLNPKQVSINNSGYQGTHQVIKFMNKLTGLSKLPLDDCDKLGKGDVLLIETPMNPEGYCMDISHYAEIAHSRGALLIVDSTLAPPPLQFPFSHKADYILYSATKYFSGHSDLLAGFVVSKYKKDKFNLHNERLSLGTNIANFDSFLLLRSLRTFKMRIQQQCTNTERVIRFLQANLSKYVHVIVKIHHSSLQLNSFVAEQLKGYYNPVFAIEFQSMKIAEEILNRFNFLSNNSNLEGGETVVELTSKNPNFVPKADQAAESTLLRFSIGCEDFEDIIKDIDQAMMSFSQ
ncbi:hypothetical protein B5S32_g1996 [[Candida] boidinii]|nr:hypothetical protein B5S29_g1582 [[Candida] boidinii]OWB77818.1 hypothetical protein B5S32_g1996 [[Candida] boidinii]